MDPWEEIRHRAPPPPRPSVVPAEPGWPHRCVRPPALPPRPSPPLAAYGRDEGGSRVRGRAEAEVARRLRQGAGVRAEREEAAAAGGNAVAVAGGLVEEGAQGVPSLAVGLVAREDRGSGGGEFGMKRGLAPAARPPPKRKAVSATRRFPPGCGRYAATPVACSGGKDGLQVGAAPFSGGFSTLEQAAIAPPSGIGGSAQRGLLLETAAADGGGNAVAIADDILENRAEGFAGLLLERGWGACSGELGKKKELPPIPRLPLNWEMVCDKPRFPRGCGRDVVAPLASGGGAERADDGLNALEKVVATSDSGSAAHRCAMGIGEVMNKDLDGLVDGQELEEGEIADTMDIVEAMNKDALDGAVEGQKLEEGEIAATMDIAEAMNKHALVGAVEGQELEDEIVAKGDGQELEADIATESDHIIQEPQVAVDVIPHDSTARVMRSKIGLTPRKTVRPPVKANYKSVLVTLDRPCSTITESFATRKKSKTAQSKHLAVDVASTSALGSKEKLPFKFLFVSKEKLKDNEASHLEDDDILKALAVHEGKLELYVDVPSGVPSIWRHKQDGGQNADARSKVRMMCRRFQFLCRFLVQAVEQRLLEVRRVDLAADKVIKKLPGFTKHRPIVGKVPGVEVGDVFLFRVELAIVGLHRPYQGGIDTTNYINGVLIAISIVASGGYQDELSSSGELIYTGSGGKAAGTDQVGDQKLQRGNLALKNCMETKTPVRVIHGFKDHNRDEDSHSKAKEISKFTYDGLYLVVDCWPEGLPGSRVFKYKLQRIPGQPELPLHVAKWLRKSVVRPDLRIANVSQRKERIPNRMINNADNVRPDRLPGER